MNRSLLYLFVLLACCCSYANAQLTEIGRIDVGANGSNNIMGVKIGPDGKIWYVDFSQRKVFRIDNSNVTSGNLDGYLSGTNTFTVIAEGAGDGLSSPIDLDFHPIRTKELWVLNQGTESTGGSTSTITNPGESNQDVDFRQDGNAWHFMALSTAMAFGDNGDWGTSQGIIDANRNGTNYTGPSLWPGDLSIYSMVGDPPTQTVNGSHLDMIHQSPYSMGIAHEKDNVYWVFDGFNDNIVRYDFREPHYPGGDDHDDGVGRRYTEVEVEKKGNLPAHMVIHDGSGWLFICDTENSRILQVAIGTGHFVSNLTPANFETLAEYSKYEGVLWSIAATGLQDPVGIDVSDNHFVIVSDNATDEIVIYNSIVATGIEDQASTSPFSFVMYPNPSTGLVRIETTGVKENTVMTLNVFDVMGKRVMDRKINVNNEKSLDLSELPSGMYHVTLINDQDIHTQKLVLRK